MFSRASRGHSRTSLSLALIAVVVGVSASASIAFADITPQNRGDAQRWESLYDTLKATPNLSLRRLLTNPDDLLSFDLSKWQRDFHGDFFNYFNTQGQLEGSYFRLVNTFGNTDACQAYTLQWAGTDKKHGVSGMADDLTALRTNLQNTIAALKSAENALQQRLNAATLKNQNTAALTAKLLNVRDTIADLQADVDGQLTPRLKDEGDQFLAAITKLGTYKCPGFAAAAPTPTPSPSPKPTAKPRPDPTGADKWEGTWISAGTPPFLSCGADTYVPGADLRMRCVAKPVLGGGFRITIEGTFTLTCPLSSPTALTSTCQMVGSWHETNLDFNVHGTVGLRYDLTMHGIHSYWTMHNDKTTRNVAGTQMYGSESQLMIVGGDIFMHH